MIWTPIFEWQVVKCGCENGHHKGIMCLKEIGVRAQNMITILGPIVNTNLGGGTHVTI